MQEMFSKTGLMVTFELIIFVMKSLLVFLFVLFCFESTAQVNVGGVPLGYKYKFSQDIPIIQLPKVDVNSLKKEDAFNDKIKSIPFRFGYKHNVQLNPKNSGVWKTLANGYRLWQLQLVSKGAISLNFIFDHFHLEDGCQLYIYNSTHTDILGAFTNRNNTIDGEFGTVLLSGESAILEYSEPPSVASQLPFQLVNVTHGYRGVKDFIAKSYGQSGNCNNNVNCPIGNGWSQEKRSVAMILVGGSAWCTGSLLNDVPQDTIPYFMTANHCYTSGLSAWQFVFNWESAGCSNSPIPMSDIVAGATLMAKNPISDFCLLRLNQKVPASFNPFFAGWNRSNSIPDSVVGIHHPSGDIKKISIADNNCQDSSYSGAFCWKVGQWTSGITEGGSSGSPLYNKYHQFVGQLFGGPSACGVSDSDKHDYYGKFMESWDHDTASTKRCDIYLDPQHLSPFTVNGFDPNPRVIANNIDAELQSILKPFNNYKTCGDSVAISIQIKNVGVMPFNQITVYSQIDNNAPVLYNWSGATLNSSFSAIINLPTLTGISLGNHQLKVFVKNPSGLSDTNTSNDSLQLTISSVVGIPLQLSIQTDDYGDETTWKLFDNSNNLMFQGGPYNQITGGELIHENNICVPSGCYYLEFYDNAGDGMCCNFGTGSFQLNAVSPNQILANGGQFGSMIHKDFCINANGFTPLTNFFECTVFPNPAHQEIQLTYTLKDTKNMEWKLTDMLGRSTILSKLESQKPGLHQLTFNIEQLHAGVYFLSNNTTYSTIIVVQ